MTTNRSVIDRQSHLEGEEGRARYIAEQPQSYGDLVEARRNRDVAIETLEAFNEKLEVLHGLEDDLARSDDDKEIGRLECEIDFLEQELADFSHSDIEDGQPHWTDVTPREEVAREYRFRESVVDRLRAGEAEVVQPWEDGGQSVSRLEGIIVVWEGTDCSSGAYLARDVTSDYSSSSPELIAEVSAAIKAANENVLAELQSTHETVVRGEGASKTTYSLEGEHVFWTTAAGASGAFSVDDVSQEFFEEQASGLRNAASAPVSDAVLDEVFEQFADDHMRSIHGIGTGDERPAMTAEQAKAFFADKEMDDFQKTLQLAEEIENGFPSPDPLFSELHDLMHAQNEVLGPPFTSSTSTANSQAAPVAAEPSNVVNLAQMMASSFKSKPGEMQQPDDRAEQAASTPRSVDFFTKPTVNQQEAATVPKLTSESRIVRLEDRDAKPKLASDELMKQGAGVSVERKAFTLSGKEIVASYQMTKGGNVVYTDYDGSKTEMSFGQAKRHEIAHLAQLNANALIAINMMATDPKFTLCQGDATYSVQNGFFCQRLDDGSFKKEPLARTQERWMARGREIEAMMPPKSKMMSELAGSFRSVPPPSDNTKAKTVEQGMTR